MFGTHAQTSDCKAIQNTCHLWVLKICSLMYNDSNITREAATNNSA